MTNKKFHNLFGQEPRDSKKDQITQFHMDVAASIQKVTEDIILKMCVSLRKEYNISNLCLAGGVALNCKMIHNLSKQDIFEELIVPPSPGDSGSAIGAANFAFLNQLKKNILDFNTIFPMVPPMVDSKFFLLGFEF